MNSKRLKIGLGLTMTLAVFGLAVLTLTIGGDDRLLRLRALDTAEPVYLRRSLTLSDDSVLRESCFDLPKPMDAVARSLKQELAGAIERRGASGYQIVVPKTADGRIQVAEYPQVSVVVGAGRLNPKAANARGEWSHVIVREHRSPTVIESVWRWLGEQFRA